MTIKAGERLPDATFYVMSADGPQQKTTQDVFAGRKVVLIGVPGAFTPTCHRNHLPGYVAKAAAIRAKGVDAIAVVSVNDVHVMSAWAKATGGEGVVEFLADGNGDFVAAAGLSLDARERGLGIRSQRFSMIVEDGVVKALNIEATPREADLSGVENLLPQL